MNTLDFSNGIFGSKVCKEDLKNKERCRIIIVSDSHGNRERLFSILKNYGDSADAFFFAGDGLQDFMYVLKEACASEDIRSFLPPVIACVHGNCDERIYKLNGGFSGYALPNSNFNFPQFVILEAAGKKIFLTHGHRFGVELGVDILLETAAAADCNIVVFGHTHIAFAKVIDNVLFINPGSITRPRGNSCAGFAVLSLFKTAATKITFL